MTSLIKQLMGIYHAESLPDLKRKFFDAHRNDDPMFWEDKSFTDFPEGCDTVEKKLEYKWYREANDHHFF